MKLKRLSNDRKGKGKSSETNWKIPCGVWKTVERPKGETVLDTRLVFKREIGKEGKVEKYKCPNLAQGFRRIKGLHHQESSLPTPTQPSIHMALALVMDLATWKGR